MRTCKIKWICINDFSRPFLRRWEKKYHRSYSKEKVPNHMGARIHLILEPERLITTPVMVIRVELLAATTPVGISATWLRVHLTFAATTRKARLRVVVVVTWVVLVTRLWN